MAGSGPGTRVQPRFRRHKWEFAMNLILSRFEQTVRTMPDKLALACEDERYTFSQLRSLAARLGKTVSQALPRGQAVGVLVRRDAGSVAAFFAALYAGCFYVPLDPDMPGQKLRTILDDAGIHLLLGTEADRSLAEAVGFSDPFLTTADAAREEASAPEAGADTPLYMVYTSGSTGKPKGVLKSHGAIVSFIDAFAETFDLDAGEILGNQTPFFFDASAKDLYLMALTGASLEIIPSEKFIFPVRLLEYMNDRNVSCICWTPTALSLVTQMNTFKAIVPKSLRKVLFVGEVFPIKQLHKWLTTLPDLRYINLYGSSEIAGICCWYEIPHGTLPEQLPMGKPLSNCRIWLHADEGFVLEPEVLGEVWIESPALALCYYGDREKTDRVFCIEQLPDGRTARVLKSGDLARFDREGNLVFSSRKDFQIKHMGRRIELGEIESVADTLPEIQRCCCLYNTTKNRIELFCQLSPGAELDGKQLQSLLRGKLSEYMFPSLIHILPEMPFNANGKIDRIRLKNSMQP